MRLLKRHPLLRAAENADGPAQAGVSPYPGTPRKERKHTMNNKTKIMLGLSALTAGTLAAGATGTLAWFTTNKTASATYNTITAKATQGSIKAKITGITDKTVTSSEYTAEATVTSASSYTADVSSTDGIHFAQPQWVSKAGNDQPYNKIENVSNKENYFTQYFITLQNKKGNNEIYYIAPDIKQKMVSILGEEILKERMSVIKAYEKKMDGKGV